MVQFRKGPANRIWNVGMFTGTALVPNGMPGGVRGTGNNRPYSISLKVGPIMVRVSLSGCFSPSKMIFVRRLQDK